MADRKTIAQRALAALRRFTEQLESGEPIKVTRVTRHETPDGPMHTFERGVVMGDDQSEEE